MFLSYFCFVVMTLLICSLTFRLICATPVVMWYELSGHAMIVNLETPSLGERGTRSLEVGAIYALRGDAVGVARR